MQSISRRIVLAGFLATLGPRGVLAAPATYAVQPDSEVRFIFSLSGAATPGTVPISGAKVTLDLAAPERSSVTIEMDARRIRAPFPIATDALRGESVLDVAHHPVIRFRSRSIARRAGGGVALSGDLTLRGVTRPITLSARLYRPPGVPESDSSRLIAELSGQLSRKDYGATGYADLVADRVDLRIVARLRQA